MSAHFDTGRLFNLFRRDLVRIYRPAAIAAAAIGAVMILQAIVAQPFETDPGTGRLGIVWLLCFVAGPVVASRAFLELHDKERNTAYLLLPASAAEKVLVRGVLVTVFLLIAAVVVVTVFAWIILLIKALAFGTVETPFVPRDVFRGSYLALFFAHQSLFLLGAAWFRRYHFVKTGLAITVLMLGLFWFAALVVRLVWPDFGSLLVASGYNPLPLLIQVAESIGWLWNLVLFVLLPAFCWIVAWLRVGETQVSHGV